VSKSEDLSVGERFRALIGRDRRTKKVTLGTLGAVLIAVVAFIALESADDEAVNVPQDSYTRTLDASCAERKEEIAMAQGKALERGGLAAVSAYADALVPIVGEWRLELGRSPVPPDRSELVEALRRALLEVEIEAGALARVARETNPREVAQVAAQVDAATVNAEDAVDSLGLVRCGNLTVDQGRLIRQ